MKVQLTYNVDIENLTPEQYQNLAFLMIGDNSDPVRTEEEFEPQVIRGELAVWLVLQSQIGNYTELVELDDFNIEEEQ
jgi:hypothetical protein